MIEKKAVFAIYDDGSISGVDGELIEGCVNTYHGLKKSDKHGIVEHEYSGTTFVFAVFAKNGKLEKYTLDSEKILEDIKNEIAPAYFPIRSE